MGKSRQGRNYLGAVFTFLLLALLSLIAAGTGGILAYSYVTNAHANLELAVENAKNPPDLHIPEDQKVSFRVASGSSTTKIANDLKAAGLIEYPQFFRILSKVNGYDGLYQSGTHIVQEGLTYEELMALLIAPPESIKLTFPEGYNMKQIFRALSNSRLTHGAEVAEYAASDEAKEELFPLYDFLMEIPANTDRQGTLEGYLFPDTYEFLLSAEPIDILKTFLNNFEVKISEDYYERAEELGFSVDQVVTLASIIEREAVTEEDRFLISGVFHNRMNDSAASMRRLQSCATIQYIFYQRNGIMLRTISDSDTRVVDPYNTYLHEGLPPGPICNPGLSAINAALYPQNTDYYFFVARGDGTHEFTKTYDEHLAAIQQYGLNLMP